MAEEDAEIALLHQMQAGQESGAWDDGTDGGADGELPSNTEHSDEDLKEENYADDQVLHAVSPSVTGVSVDNGLVDTVFTPLPAAVTAASQIDSRSSSRASARKSKTMGGFVADSSDSEEETPASNSPSAGLLHPPNADGPSRSFSRSPLQQSSTIGIPSVARSIMGASTDYASPINAGDNGDIRSQTTSTQPTLPVAPPPTGVIGLKARLPHDKVGIFEDRIQDDPRGDLEAWFSLIAEHRKRNKLDDARSVYERFLKVFPTAADTWVEYAEMELANDNFFAAEQIFGKSLLSVASVQLWSVYLNYIRRRNDLTNDVTGTARATISQAYDFVLANVGVDRDSGRIWQEYIQFVRGAPGLVGGSSWQDQQKMDQMRKAYQRAIGVPMSSLNILWKEYDQFEMSLNKITGRKFIQERSPAYMTARSANTTLENATRGLVRNNIPHLPPAFGFEGHEEYLRQVDFWHKWIVWEQEDPLVLKEEDIQAYKQRILYVYKQAVMALRFWPEIWVEAAEWCFLNSMEAEGNDFLTQGIAANPESCLLAFKQGDRLEMVLPVEEGEEGLASRGAAVRAPYNKLHDALYDLIKKLKARETAELARIEEAAALDARQSELIGRIDEEDDEEGEQDDVHNKEIAKANQIRAVQLGYAAQTQLLSRTISFAWIALMRAMRRVQGKGKVGGIVGGSRQILNDARLKGRITSDVYVASALIEHNVYKDPAGTKIFERGAKLFPEDEVFILQYLKHLLSIGDTTNARAVFETSVNRLAQKSELIGKTKPLYVFFHKYESEYGELSQINKLERRMGDLFPEDPKLSHFASRYSVPGFDPTVIRPIVSTATQMRTKLVVQSIEQPTSAQNSPRPQYTRETSLRPQVRPESPRPTYLQANNSPKRPFVGEDSDGESNRPRKLVRGESPLKGAAGRRLDQQKRLQQTQGVPSWQSNGPAPFVIPRDITFLLSIIPRAETYTASRFNPEAMARLLSQTQVPDYPSWKAAQNAPPARYDNGYPYVR